MPCLNGLVQSCLFLLQFFSFTPTIVTILCFLGCCCCTSCLFCNTEVRTFMVRLFVLCKLFVMYVCDHGYEMARLASAHGYTVKENPFLLPKNTATKTYKKEILLFEPSFSFLNIYAQIKLYAQITTWVMPIAINLNYNYFFFHFWMYCSKWQAFKLASLSGFAEPLGVIIVGNILCFLLLCTILVCFSFQRIRR